MQEPRIKIEGVKYVLAVASGKGGVGKSTVSVNLALALAGLGYRVGLFDGDLHGPNIPLMLGARRKGRVEGDNASVAIAISRDYENEVRKGQPLERYGLKVMSIGLLVGEEQPVVGDTNLLGRMALQLLRSVEWGELDFLLIDLPPGTGEPQITFCQRLQLDGVVLVSTPPDVAILDTTKALNLYRDRGVPVLGLVENMSYYICPVCHDRREIFPRSEREAERSVRSASVPVLGRIPLNPAVGQAGDSGRPLLITDPAGEIAGAFRAAAAQVVQTLDQLPPVQTGPEPVLPTTAYVSSLPAPVADPTSAPVGFQSTYLTDLANRLLAQVRQRLPAGGTNLKRDETGMQTVVEAYRTVWANLGGTLPGELQKELVAFVLTHILPA